MDLVAHNRHLDAFKWLNETHHGCTIRAMNRAAESGHHHIVKWLHQNRTEGCTSWAMDLAACNGHLDVVKFLHENRTEGCTSWAMDWAAGRGHLDVVKFLHENRTEGCTQIAMDYASCNSNTEILEFLYNNYKHLVTKVNDKTYEDLLPFIQEDFRKVFRKIEKENIVREFISKKLVYHPSSCYMKRIVDNF